MAYSYKFRKSGQYFWRKVKNLKGHQLSEGKMIFFHENGSQTIIAEWQKYDARLGVDWFLFVKKEMESEAGIDLKVK